MGWLNVRNKGKRTGRNYVEMCTVETFAFRWQKQQPFVIFILPSSRNIEETEYTLVHAFSVL